MAKFLLNFLMGINLLLVSTDGISEDDRLTTSTGNEIVADYLAGTTDTNPILLLHGFLQTNEFSTVSRLATALNDSGYTVLNPTLSLGISNRKQSLACEAIHTHSLDSDAAEVGQWVDWMYKKTGKPVILVGHSAGGPVILKYMEDYNSRYVDNTILISLSYYNSRLTAEKNREGEQRAVVAVNNG